MARIPKEHEDAMIEAYLNGATQEQAGALFGYHQTTCAGVLKRRGIMPRKAGGSRRMPKEHEDSIIEAYLAGATLEEAAALSGYNKETCSDVLKRRGIAVRERRMPREHEDAIVAAYLAGATQEQAAALFGYHETTCANVLKRRGIPLRTLSEALSIPNEHEDAIIAAYLSGASAAQAVAPFGYSRETCFSALKRRGITPRSNAEVLRIPFEHEEAIVTAYLGGATQAQAAALFGYSGNACLNALKRRGIVPRSFQEVARRYTADETFFDQIDTEEKAYWLGFLTADGGIAKNRIMLALKVNDIGHVHKFVTSLQSDYPVTIVNRKSYGGICTVAQVTIHSILLVQALLQLGVGERKSFAVLPCQNIPPSLLSAYWRGIFDGDGSIFYYGNSPRSIWQLSLCGNEHIVTGFRDFISEFVISKAAVRPQSSIFQIQYGGIKLAQSVARVLYSNATIYLDRKYALAKKLCGDLS